MAVIDIRMPPDHETEGLDAARRIHADHPGIGIVVLSQYVNALYALALSRDGTDGLAYPSRTGSGTSTSCSEPWSRSPRAGR